MSSDGKEKNVFCLALKGLTINIKQQKGDLKGNYVYDNSLQNTSIPVPKHSQ